MHRTTGAHLLPPLLGWRSVVEDWRSRLVHVESVNTTDVTEALAGISVSLNKIAVKWQGTLEGCGSDPTKLTYCQS